MKSKKLHFNPSLGSWLELIHRNGFLLALYSEVYNSKDYSVGCFIEFEILTVCLAFYVELFNLSVPLIGIWVETFWTDKDIPLGIYLEAPFEILRDSLDHALGSCFNLETLVYLQESLFAIPSSRLSEYLFSPSEPESPSSEIPSPETSSSNPTIAATDSSSPSVDPTATPSTSSIGAACFSTSSSIFDHLEFGFYMEGNQNLGEFDFPSNAHVYIDVLANLESEDH